MEMERRLHMPEPRGVLVVLSVFIVISTLLVVVDHRLAQTSLASVSRYRRLVVMDASLLLLMPLYIWWRMTASKRELPPVRGGPRWMTWGSVLLVFGLAFALRTVLTLQDTLLREKIPVTYLVVLFVVVGEGLAPSSMGLSWRRASRHILLGLFLFLIFAMPTTLGVTGLMTGRNPFRGFDFRYLALSLPFQLLGVALAEEALFRGYMQTKLETLMRPWSAILLQAIFFGAWHFVRWVKPLRLEPMAFHVMTSLLFGIVLGTYYHHTRNLIAPIVLHASFNSVLAAAGLSAWRLASTGPMYMSLAGLAALALAVLVVGLARQVSALLGARSAV
jgi:membrane protease YdiL (CAAX protease family)